MPAAGKSALGRIAANKVAANKIAANRVAASEVAANKVAADRVAAGNGLGPESLTVVGYGRKLGLRKHLQECYRLGSWAFDWMATPVDNWGRMGLRRRGPNFVYLAGMAQQCSDVDADMLLLSDQERLVEAKSLGDRKDDGSLDRYQWGSLLD